MSKMMKGIIHSAKNMVWGDVPAIGQLGSLDVAVEVFATAVNRADLLQRTGKYPPPPGASELLGLEIAGRVKEVGDQVTRWKVGDRVMGLLAGGGYAEAVRIHEGHLMHVPNGMSLTKAATLPEALLTCYLNLFREAKLKSTETALIYGGGSGIGTIGIQMAKAAGCTVVTVAGSDEKLAFCKTLGADQGVNYKTSDLMTALPPVDVILDHTGGSSIAANINALKPKGRMVMIATMGGTSATIDVRPILLKQLHIMGSMLRPRSLEEKAEIIRDFESRFWGDLESGRIRPIVYKELPITEAEEAHAILARNENVGKVSLVIKPDTEV